MNKHNIGDIVRIEIGTGPAPAYMPLSRLGRVLNWEQSYADGHYNYAVKFYDGDCNVFVESRLLAPFNTPVVDCHETLGGEFFDRRAPMICTGPAAAGYLTNKGRIVCTWRYGRATAPGQIYAVPAGYRGLYVIKTRKPTDPVSRRYRWVMHEWYGETI